MIRTSFAIPNKTIRTLVPKGHILSGQRTGQGWWCHQKGNRTAGGELNQFGFFPFSGGLSPEQLHSAAADPKTLSENLLRIVETNDDESVPLLAIENLRNRNHPEKEIMTAAALSPNRAIRMIASNSEATPFQSLKGIIKMESDFTDNCPAFSASASLKKMGFNSNQIKMLVDENPKLRILMESNKAEYNRILQNFLAPWENKKN